MIAIAERYKQYTHFSFDLDGTLAHTLPQYRYEIVPSVVDKLGGKIDGQNMIDLFWFGTNRDRIVQEAFGIEPLVFWELFSQIDSSEYRAQHTYPYEESQAVLNALKACGKTVSIITGSPEWIAKMEIEKINASYDFHFSIAYSGFKDKPDPGAFLFVLDKLNIPVARTIYIGNSLEDAQFAENAGVDFVMIERGEHDSSLEWVGDKIYSLNELFEVI